mgnify:CR=1 FL=1
MGEKLDLERFEDFGIVKSEIYYNEELLDFFLEKIDNHRNKGYWIKQDLVELFKMLLPEFQHLETGKYLDSKM